MLCSFCFSALLLDEKNISQNRAKFNNGPSVFEKERSKKGGFPLENPSFSSFDANKKSSPKFGVGDQGRLVCAEKRQIVRFYDDRLLGAHW